jgi:DNA mismatch repair ATPase MutS
MNTPDDVFNQRVNDFKLEWKTLNNKHNSIALLRVVIFILVLTLIIVFANYGMGKELMISIIVFPFIFGLVVKAHNKISYQRKRADILSKINAAESKIFNGNLSEQEQGIKFKDKLHPYINDLDIFGQNSVFQLLNRCTTEGGRELLAKWLSHFSKKSEIEKRQTAVKELTSNINWRQEFQAHGLHKENSLEDPEPLIHWLKTPYNYNSVFKVIAFIFPALTIVSILLNVFLDTSIYYSVGIFFISGFILKQFSEHIKNLSESVSQHVGLLATYSALIKHLETSSFESERLKLLKSYLHHDDHKASVSIQNLYKILDFLNARSNFFYFIIDTLLLFDLHIVFMAERWKKKNQADIALWFGTISEFEAINSIAGFAYSNPNFIFPKISDGDYKLEISEIAHPLIKKHERISNNYSLQGMGGLTIITGSNMSGKSTFLRTLGVNVVLGLSGAPVCAKEMTVSELQIFTSMRTEDNLEEHVSSFYAELQRIKALLEEVEKGKPVLFMLDEILKGTNSQDRHIGAVSLAKQLSKTSAFGLISTHDLELGKLEKELKNVSNYSFNSEVKGDEIIFPYKLDEGICKSFNASALMEKMGIKIFE